MIGGDVLMIVDQQLMALGLCSFTGGLPERQRRPLQTGPSSPTQHHRRHVLKDGGYL